jgi:cell division protein FtsB
MAQFQRKSTSSLWHSPLMLCTLFAIVLIFMYNMVGIIEKARDTHKKTAMVRAEIEELGAREEALAGDIAKLKTDEGTEVVLRDKYQLVKSGEKMVVIVDQQASASAAVPEAEKRNNFIEFFKKLFKK